MAAGDTLQQRGGSFGIAYESTPGTAESAPVYFLTVEDANIMKEPVSFERVNNIGAERIGIQQAGHDVSWEFSGAELGIEEVGYLLWLMLGNEVNTTGSHAISPQFSSQRFTALLDHGGVIDSSVIQTQRAVSCRMDALSFELNPREYGKWSGSGLAIKDAPLATGLSPALDLTADNAPLSWANLSTLTMTFNNGTSRTVTYPRSLSVNFQRSIERSAIALGTSETREILEGGRMVDATIVLDVVDSDDIVGETYAAVENGHDVEISMLFVTGTSTFAMALGPMRITNDPFGPIGSGDGAQEMTLELSAFQDSGGGPIALLNVLDNNATDYDGR